MFWITTVAFTKDVAPSSKDWSWDERGIHEVFGKILHRSDIISPLIRQIYCFMSPRSKLHKNWKALELSKMPRFNQNAYDQYIKKIREMMDVRNSGELLKTFSNTFENIVRSLD